MNAPLQPTKRQQVLDLLRFPLAIVVLTIHTWSSDGFYLQGELVDVQTYPFFREINYWIDGFLRGQSVPIYFFISGFVFFFGVEWNCETYRRKLKNRVKTLLIPYLVWNAIAIALDWAKCLPIFSRFRAFDADFHFSIKALLNCFWNYTGELFPMQVSSNLPAGATYPIDIPLWFLRDLMIVVLCAPLLYKLLKRTGAYSIVCMGVLWFVSSLADWEHIGQLICAFFFFSWGAYLSIHRKDMLEVFGRWFRPSMLAYPLLALAYVAAMHYWPEAAPIIKQLNVLAGLFFAYNAAAWLLDRGICKPNAFLSASSFFIYVAHWLVCSRMLKVLFILVRPESDIALILVYASTVVLTTVLLLGTFYLMKRYTPRLLKIVAGRA